MNAHMPTPKHCIHALFFFAALAMLAFSPSTSATTRSYAFEEGRTFVVNTALGVATQIILDKDERVTEFGTGYSSGWEISRRENVFYIKPKDPDAETNMYIKTDKRAYMFDLRLVSKDWKKIEEAKAAGVHYVILFDYPENRAPRAPTTAELLVSPSSISPSATGHKSYYTKYEVAADVPSRWLVPVRVYDDGAFTYVQFADRVSSPAIFARSTLRAQEYVVNKTVSGDSMQIVHGVHAILVVRHGDSLVAIRRQSE